MAPDLPILSSGGSRGVLALRLCQKEGWQAKANFRLTSQ
jgi:hypothetical protein